MSDITKIKVDGELESTYKLFSKNREFEKRAGGNTGSQSGVQPDWNQNDETQPDYVKNRPFYTGGPVETVLVEESTASFVADDEGNGLYMSEFQSTFEATVGETYKVYWDGASYECTCVKFNNTLAIGNLSIVGDASDTGEPFLIGTANRKRIDILTADTSDSHTFSIGKTVVPVVKIDEKYLPTIPAPIYIIGEDPVFSSSATFEEVWKLPPNVLASRLTFASSASLAESGLGFSCREVNKANSLNHGKYIVATFAILSVLNNSTYDVQDYAIVWNKTAITKLTPDKGS